MAERKINLEGVLKLHCNIADYEKEAVLKAMKMACKQTLELSAENATLLNNGVETGSFRYVVDSMDTYYNEVEIDISKQSIINTINQIE